MMELTYDLMFLDLDGTLLSFFKRIPKKNLLALKQFSELGGKLIIATGKTYFNTKKYVEKINNYIKTPIEFCACLNGNVIFDLRHNQEQLIYEGLINNYDCKEIYHACKRNKVVFAPYTKMGVEKGRIHSTNGATLFGFFNHFNTWSIRNLRGYQTMQSYKINIISKFLTTKKLRLTYSQLSNNKNIEILKTKKHFYEVVPKNSNKGNALKIISKCLNISPSRTVAIGDSSNDLPMFKVAGLSISVGADGPEFHQACQFFVKSRRNKVAKAIQKFVI